jgi:hypothetical protein
MRNAFLPVCLVTGIILFCIACSQPVLVDYATALKVYKETDSSRAFDTTSRQSPHYYRPVKIDLYYPSTDKPAGDALQYGDLLDMYEQRMNYHIPLDSCKKASRQLARIFADYLHLDTASRILDCPTQIYTGLSLPAKKHPLIIYAAGMNGSSWENAILFDSLTKAGYIIAAISSVGTFPGYMTGATDLEEQVQDILFTCRKMKQLPFVDATKIGLLSWSMGGSAITKAAMLSKEFKCLLSMDGTDIHYYGFDKDWDKEYLKIKATGIYNPAAISIPYMYLSGEHPKGDSVDVFPDHITSKQTYFVKFTGGTHEDFSSIVSVVKQAGPELGNLDNSRHQVVCGLVLTFFNQYLSGTGNIQTTKYIAGLMKQKPGSYSVIFPGK